MINNVIDLKSRMLVESNTLKSFILAANDGKLTPTRDAILIHDYQIANSVTINSILANYVIDLQYAWKQYFLSTQENRDSYFKIVNSVQETESLADETKLVLMVDGGYGSFYGRTVGYDVRALDNVEGLVNLLNLDTIWYGLVRTEALPTNFDSNGDVIMCDSLQLINGMNDFDVNPNKFGTNPFENGQLLKDGSQFVDSYHTFNQFVQHCADVYQKSIQINCITENQFYGSQLDLSNTSDETTGSAIKKSKYLVCLSTGFYGLTPNYNVLGEFTGMSMYDIGITLKNLDTNHYQEGKFEFVFCGFMSVDSEVTLFVVIDTPDDAGNKKYHYLFLNATQYDNIYGMTDISWVRMDQLVTDKENVFTNVKQIKGLGEIPIAMTDYGFWDIEPNTTKQITYSYRGVKDCFPVGNYNAHLEKLILPTTQIGPGQIVSEYDKIWTLANGRYSNSAWSEPTYP